MMMMEIQGFLLFHKVYQHLYCLFLNGELFPLENLEGNLLSLRTFNRDNQPSSPPPHKPLKFELKNYGFSLIYLFTLHPFFLLPSLAPDTVSSSASF